MKKNLFRLICALLALSLLISLPACNSAGYKVTGKIEDGKLTVWLSPAVTDMYKNLQNNFVNDFDIDYEYNSDLVYVEFDSEKEFREALAQKIITGDGPDLILARPSELTSKMLYSDMFLDISPFFEYEYKNGTMDKDDIMTSVFASGTFEGKLLAVPLDFSFVGMTAQTALDAKGLKLISQPDITTAELLQQYNDWLAANGNQNEYRIWGCLPPIALAYTDFIDYKNGTTRMGEDEVYDYFCKSIRRNKSSDDFYTDGTYIADLYKQSTGTSIDPENTDETCKASLFLSSQVIYNTNYSALNELKGGSNFDSTAEETVLPYITEDGNNKYYGSVSICALIPANASKKEKAFSYIKLAYNAEFLLSNPYINGLQIPMLKSVIRSEIDAVSSYTDKGKDDIYRDITERKLVFCWEDAQVAEWLGVYTNSKYDEKSNTFSYPDPPTRKEWNELKKKIELYLNE